MQLTFLKGYPDYIGKRFAWCGYGNGPTSYVNTGTTATTGDPLTFPRFDNYIDSIQSGGTNSTSGTYYYRAQGYGVGSRQTWVLRYYVSATNAEVANGVNLSAETFQVSGLGGVY